MVVLLAAAGLALAGCSAIRLTYNQGPTLAYWWLDRYADFSSEQAPRVRAALNDWFSWHRSTQLADYQQALAQVQRLAAADTQADAVCAQIEAWRQRADSAFEQAVPAIADIVRSASPAQINHLEQRNAKNLAEAEHDYLQPLLADRREANYQRTLDRAETLYGRLGEAQRKLLADGLAASPFDPLVWLAERHARQQDTVAALRRWQASRADAATVQAGLRRMAQDMLQSPRADYRAYAQRVNAANCALLAQLHNSTTTAQRRKAADNLRGWEEDLRVLAAQAAPARAPTPGSLPSLKASAAP
jgi:hypothetical protein